LVGTPNSGAYDINGGGPHERSMISLQVSSNAAMARLLDPEGVAHRDGDYWMAGLLYLPRLFVYHTDAPKGSAQSDTFKVKERRLLRGLVNSAITLVWLLGPAAHLNGMVAGGK
jgi:hypothetical protein